MAAAEEAAAEVLERLRALSCPAVVSLPPLPPAQALRLLCDPSPQRQALLEWLCCRLYPPLAECLDALQSNDARLQELATLGASLMLCKDQDLALVEGTALPEEQLEFIWDLLAAAPPGEEETPPDDTSAVSEFLQQLLIPPEGREVLSPLADPPPLPTFDSPQPRSPSPLPSPLPSMPALEAALEDARCQLQLLEAQNAELGEGSAGPAPPMLPSLALAGGDLGALAAAFGGSELWDTPGRMLGEGATCGPLASHVWGGLQLLVQSLGLMTQLGETAAEVAQFGGGSQQQARETLVAALWQRFGETPRAGEGS